MATAQSVNIRKELLGQGIGNIAANGLIAWLLLRNKDELALWSFDGVALDVALTSLLLTFIVSWIVMATQKSGLRKGKLNAVEPDRDKALHRILMRAPAATGWAALCFGLTGLLVFAPLTLLGFQLLGVYSIATMHYVIFKALWTGAMAAVVVIPGIYIALLRRA